MHVEQYEKSKLNTFIQTASLLLLAQRNLMPDLHILTSKNLNKNPLARASRHQIINMNVKEIKSCYLRVEIKSLNV